MCIKTIVLHTNGHHLHLLAELIHTKIGDKYKNLEFSHGLDGCGPKTIFSIAESSVTVSGDLIEYSGSGIVNRSITPIF